jgi:predicted nucleic acid-binding protein
MARILIDSSAIYALVVPSDAYHLEAVAFLRVTLKHANVFVLLDLVFAETMTLLRARGGTAFAVPFGHELRRNPAYHWQPLGVEGERDTWAAFQQYDDKAWSYTDCALLAMAQRLAVPQVFSFDSHIDQMPYVVRVPQP